MRWAVALILMPLIVQAQHYRPSATPDTGTVVTTKQLRDSVKVMRTLIAGAGSGDTVNYIATHSWIYGRGFISSAGSAAYMDSNRVPTTDKANTFTKTQTRSDTALSSGIVLTNTTPATLSVQQHSPMMSWTTQSWDRTGSSSHTSTWDMFGEGFSSAGYGGDVLCFRINQAGRVGYPIIPFAIDETGRFLIGTNFTGQNFSTYGVILGGDYGDVWIGRYDRTIALSGNISIQGTASTSMTISPSVPASSTDETSITFGGGRGNHSNGGSLYFIPGAGDHGGSDGSIAFAYDGSTTRGTVGIGGAANTYMLGVTGKGKFTDSLIAANILSTGAVNGFTLRQGSALSDTTKFLLTTSAKQGAYLSDTTKFPLWSDTTKTAGGIVTQTMRKADSTYRGNQDAIRVLYGDSAKTAGGYVTQTMRKADTTYQKNQVALKAPLAGPTFTGAAQFSTTNSSTATIGAGDSVQVSVTSLTSAGGIAVVAYKMTAPAATDTAATWNVSTAGKLTIFGKFGRVVSYWVTHL